MKVNYKCQLRFDGKSIFVLYTAFVMVLYILPSLKTITPYIFAASIMLIFLPLAMQRNFNFCVVLLLATFVSAIFYFINGVYGLTDVLNEIIRYIRLFMPTLWTIYALRSCSLKQQRNILIVFGVITAFVLFRTMNALENDMWISRILAQDKMTDTAEIRAYRMANVGGFGFSYMMGIVVISLAWAVMRVKKKSVKIFCIIGAVVGFYYIIQTMYMTLLILTSVAIILLLLFNTKNMYIKFFILIASVVLAFSLVPLFRYLSEVFSDSLLSTKFSQFYDALTGGGIDSLGARPDLIFDAVSRWLKSPIWGGYATSAQTHSYVFSTLEAIGLIGICAFFWCLFKAYKSISTELKNKKTDTILLTIVFLYFIALAILNPIGYVFEVAIVSFFITPLWSCLIVSSDQNYNSDKLSHSIMNSDGG